MINKEWSSRERRLWDELFSYSPVTYDSRKGRKLRKAAKLAGKEPPELPSEAEAVAKSWQRYHAWLRNE
jgi:hypothetical protein